MPKKYLISSKYHVSCTIMISHMVVFLLNYATQSSVLHLSVNVCMYVYFFVAL